MLPLLALGTGIVIAAVWHFQNSEFLWELPALSAITLLAWRCGQRLFPACLFLTFVICGALLSASHPSRPIPTMDATAREIVIVTGCVVTGPAFSETRDQFVLELAPHARAQVTLSLREGEAPPGLRYGQRIDLEARLRRIRNFQNPGEFDYERFSARKGIYWTASAIGASSITMQQGRCGSQLLGFLFAVRTQALAKIQRLFRGDEYATGMMEATLLGESSRMERLWTDHFKRTGTYHMLVIDGLHITVLAAFLLFLLRLCFVREITALAITASGAWFYALISGWNAPAIRAAGGFTLYVIARYFYRRGRMLNLLAAVAMIYLIYDPSELFDAGFQLSFLAVAAIALFALPILEVTSRLYATGIDGITEPGRVPRLAPRAAQFRLELRLLAETAGYYIRLPVTLWERGLALAARMCFYAWELAVISAVIQIGLALPMAIYFHRISLTGISANILVVPLLALVVPLGFLAILTSWQAPAAAALWLLRAGARIADWHTHLEPQWRVLAPPLWLAVAFSVALLCLAFAIRRSGRWWGLAIVAVLALFALIFWHPFRPKVQPGQLELAVIDVGQGDSLLLSFPDSKLMLVDAGGVVGFGRQGTRAAGRLDIGEDVVSPYLWSRSIRKIDVVALTHAHDDHAGGLPAVIENFHPSELWTGAIPDGGNASGATWRGVRAAAQAAQTKIVPLSSGRSFRFGGARIEVVSPPPDYVPATAPENNDSLALRISYGRRSILLTGDMEKPMEWRALSAGEPLRADVLKVGHHGSNTSSVDPFLDAVAPEFAVISDGFENSFRHPHPQVLERLKAHRAGIFRTDRDGLVTIRTDGQYLFVQTFHVR